MDQTQGGCVVPVGRTNSRPEHVRNSSLVVYEFNCTAALKQVSENLNQWTVVLLLLVQTPTVPPTEVLEKCI